MNLLSKLKVIYHNYRWKKLLKEISKDSDKKDKEIEKLETWKAIMTFFEKD